MLRLARSDFDDPTELAGLAAAAGTTPERIRAELGYLVERPAPAASVEGTATAS
jgi:hypothetical protein